MAVGTLTGLPGVDGHQQSCRCADCTRLRRREYARLSRLEMGVRPRTAPEHGTRRGYMTLKCREECCMAAMREYQRRWRESNPERSASQRKYESLAATLPVGSVIHGVTGYALWACRCTRCIEGAVEWCRSFGLDMPDTSGDRVWSYSTERRRRGVSGRGAAYRRTA